MKNRKSMNRRKKAMYIILSIIIIFAGVIMLFFQLPYSKTKAEFIKTVNSLMKNTKENSDVFTLEDIKDLPLPVQKYFIYCGYIYKPKMSSIMMNFKDVDFIMDSTKNKTIKIDYTQYNFVEKPERFAYINYSMMGIPFEGFDSYLNGKGSMKGVLAKGITLFNQRGEAMDKACLVTHLSESLILPNVALQDYITWESIDDTHARATSTYYGITVSGVFTFDENGAMLSFRTSDRLATDPDGTTRKADWSEVCNNYVEINGIKQPTSLQAVWHFEEGDLLYFNGNNVIIEYK
jgi:hypothetical protein